LSAADVYREKTGFDLGVRGSGRGLASPVGPTRRLRSDAPRRLCTRLRPAAEETFELLSQVIGRIGEQGRLRMSVERATIYFRSTGTGYILTQIGLPQ